MVTLVERFQHAPFASNAFTIIATGLWLFAFRWAWRHQQFYRLALILATIYCFLSEYLAIQLGKYHYATFAFSIPMHESEFTPVSSSLQFLQRLNVIPFQVECVGHHFDRSIPLEVALLEASLIFAVFRLTNLLAPLPPPADGAPPVPLAERLPNPLLNAFLAVSLDSILDPVVSGTIPCDTHTLERFDGLALWTWHTTADYRGYWFGVPLANYTAWFAAVFAFTYGVRVGRHRLQAVGTLFQRGKSMIFATVRAVALLVILLFSIKFPLDILIYGIPGTVGSPTPKAWQFGVFGVLLAASLYVGLRRKEPFRIDSRIEWPPLTSLAVIFLYCFFALWLAVARPYGKWLIPLWIATSAVAVIHGLAPFGGIRVRAKPDPTAQEQQSA
jgi:hypothetical protein